MAVRSALPWPLRWALLAIVFGFCAAIGLWAFEFGKDIAGLDHGTKEELQRVHADLLALRGELATMKEARDKAQSIANTADTLLTTEKVSKERLATQNKQLEADNRNLRDDLGFFEALIPTSGVGGIAIRGLQAELHGGRELTWQVMVMQSLKNAPELSARLELSFVGVQNGKPWQTNLPGGAKPLKLKQYGRIKGSFELPAHTTIKGVTAKVLEGSETKAVQSIKL
jgi:hypothetical protein